MKLFCIQRFDFYHYKRSEGWDWITSLNQTQLEADKLTQFSKSYISMYKGTDMVQNDGSSYCCYKCQRLRQEEDRLGSTEI